MPEIRCPLCGEDEELRGVPPDPADAVAPDALMLRCDACGGRWQRDATPTCRLCGSTDLQPVATATLREHGRGDQWAPSGLRPAYYCWDCHGADVTSASPQPGPQPPPGGGRDLKALRHP